jgi:hypothetical protein
VGAVRALRGGAVAGLSILRTSTQSHRKFRESTFGDG